MFGSFEFLKKLPIANHVLGLQPLSMEGTTLASSCMYTHDPLERGVLLPRNRQVPELHGLWREGSLL